MLSPTYLTRKLTSPIPTKDGGTLGTIGEACEYMAAIGKERELRPHWQRVRELMLQEADVAALSSRVRLAVLKDAKLDVTALSEPIERWMDEPLSSLLSDGKLNVVEKDEPPKEPTESNDRSDGDREEGASRTGRPPAGRSSTGSRGEAPPRGSQKRAFLEPIPCNAPRSEFMIMRRIDRGVLARAVGRGAPRPHRFRRMAPPLKHG